MDITTSNTAYLSTTALAIDIEGRKPGEMAIFSSGRQTGKSMLTMLKTKYYSANLCKEIMLPTSPVKQQKYQFSRANWYQAEFDDRHYFEVDAWCSQQFGLHPSRPDAWSRWWHKFQNSILFRD